mmetsp:Transcript_119442/g.254871  ORF Transcript_119442/g.254871 Transcript_119442/m.254871 type:complete len:494 (+) Transcript_119442:107-1588(+)
MVKLIALLAVLAIQAGLCFRVGEIEAEASALWEGGQHPVHMSKLAAFGKDLAEFIENAENNNLLAGSGLMEVNATSGMEATKEVVSQRTFCPMPWRARLGKKGTYVGGGAFGKVYVSKLTCDESMVAIKVQKRTKETDAESNLMMGLDHPNVIKAFATAKGPGYGQTSLLMEACSGGDLDGMKSLPSSVKARLFYETFKGVAYMHQQGLVHSDLKLENVMLSSKCASSGADTCHSKVADLGLTCSLRRSGECNGIAGTPLYMSPGLIQSGRRSQPDDLWSLGVMLHDLVKGSLPSFLLRRFTSVEQLLTSVRGKSGYAYSPQDGSAKEQLLAGLLVGSAGRRISADAAAALAERWVAQERGTLEATPLATKPECWAQCEQAACDWKTSSCTLDAENAAQCVGEENPTAGDEEEARILSVMIRKGYTGSLGFKTAEGGPRVTEVARTGPAMRAGLRVGDFIVQLQNMPWNSISISKRRQIIQQSPVVTLGVQRR